MKKVLFYFMILLDIFILGCSSIEVSTTKRWEGHYRSSVDFYENTKDIKLERGESIWVLSNSSLSRVLKQQGK